MILVTDELYPLLVIDCNGLKARVLDIARKGDWAAIRVEFLDLGFRRSIPAAHDQAWTILDFPG